MSENNLFPPSLNYLFTGKRGACFSIYFRLEDLKTNVIYERTNEGNKLPVRRSRYS